MEINKAAKQPRVCASRSKGACAPHQGCRKRLARRWAARAPAKAASSQGHACRIPRLRAPGLACGASRKQPAASRQLAAKAASSLSSKFPCFKALCFAWVNIGGAQARYAASLALAAQAASSLGLLAASGEPPVHPKAKLHKPKELKRL